MYAHCYTRITGYRQGAHDIHEENQWWLGGSGSYTLHHPQNSSKRNSYTSVTYALAVTLTSCLLGCIYCGFTLNTICELINSLSSDTVLGQKNSNHQWEIVTMFYGAIYSRPTPKKYCHEILWYMLCICFIRRCALIQV